MKFFSYAPGTGFEWHDTAGKAKAAAEERLREERSRSKRDGWSDDVTAICWGGVSETATMVNKEP